MLNVYLRTPQTDAGAWLNFPASYQTVQHLFSVLGDLLDEEKVGQEMRRSDMGTYTEYSQTVCRIRNGMTEFICRIFLICQKA